VGAIFYFTNRTLTGSNSLSALTAEADNRCHLSIAPSSPNFFHQSHFDWEQESLRSSLRKPLTVAKCPLHIRRQTFFANRTLTGNMSLFGFRSEAANRPLHLRRQTIFTNHTLTGRRILRLLNCTMVGLTADKPPSLRHVLTLKKFRTTKCPL